MNDSSRQKRERDLKEEDDFFLLYGTMERKISNNGENALPIISENENCNFFPSLNDKSSSQNEYKSQVFQSQIRSSLFLNCIWKIEIPKKEMSSFFQYIERIEEHRTRTPVNFFIHYDRRYSSELEFSIQIGEGEDIEMLKDIQPIDYEAPQVKAQEEPTIVENTNLAELEMNNENDISEARKLENRIFQFPSHNHNNWESRSHCENNDQNERTNSSLEKSTHSQPFCDYKAFPPVESRIQNDCMPIGEYFIAEIAFNIVDFQQCSITSKPIKPGKLQRHHLSVNWENIKYSSKEIIVIIFDISVTKNTTFVSSYTGLINEGMTCYMNSLLQSLNMLGYFKKALFGINNSFDIVQRKSIVRSFQKLFYQLMTEKKPVSTCEIISSFGWGREQLLVQRDFQEFFLRVSEEMEKELRDTPVEGTFRHLFEGRILNYIECLNVEVSSKKEETFYDIQLTVKGCSDLYQSFDKFTEEEVLDKDNKYQTEHHGKQEAKKGIRFISLPNVLILQLKRFEYNYVKETLEKINDRFIFYEQINLGKYIDPPSTGQDEVCYHLHAVVVHSGIPNGGHYYSFILPEIGSHWYKFNDESVKKAEEYEVFQNNFGGNHKIFRHIANGNVIDFTRENEESAYILFYIKSSTRDSILCPCEIPPELKQIFIQEREEEERQKEIAHRKSMNWNLDIFTKEILLHHTQLGITHYTHMREEKECESEDFNKLMLNVPKDIKIKTFIKLLSLESNIPEDMFVLFKCVLDLSYQYFKRFSYQMVHIDENSYEKNIFEIAERDHNKKIIIYIHVKSATDACQFELLEKNPDFKQKEDNNEIAFTDEEKRVRNTIYYNKNINYWKIKKNHHLLENFPVSMQKSQNNLELQRVDNLVLCVIKFPKITYNENTNDITFTLTIDDAILVKKGGQMDMLENTIDIRRKYLDYIDPQIAKLIPDYANSEISFFVEFTSIENRISTLSNLQELKTLYLVPSKYSIENIRNDGICIIPNLQWKESVEIGSRKVSSIKQLIIEKINELVLSIPLSFISSMSNGELKALDKILNIPKDVIDISSNENIIASLICEYFSSHFEALSHYFFDTCRRSKDFRYYLLDSLGVLTPISDILNPTIIEFISSKEYLLERIPVNQFPLVKYINFREMSITFKINFLGLLPAHESQSTYTIREFILCDACNNPIQKIYAIVPRNLEQLKSIINFLETSVLMKFYSHCKTDMMFSLIIQNPFYLTIHEFISNPNEFVRYYYACHAQYRIQPFPRGELENNINASVVHACVYFSDETPACFPLIAVLEKNSKISTLKSKLTEKLEHVIEIQELFLDINTKISFFVCSFITKNIKPKKDFLINSSVDDETIDHLFEGKFSKNILIELQISSSCSAKTNSIRYKN